MMGLRVLGILLLATPIFCADFTYDNGPHGPANWASLFPHDCAGSKQSPINLKSSETSGPGNLWFVSSYDLFQSSTSSGTVTNNGHSVVLTFNGNMQITGSGIQSDMYKVDQLHYHFGSVNGQGSEHTINGKHYEAEMHLVTHNTKYSSLSEAQTHPNGVAVFGGMIEVGSSDNELYTKFLSAVEKIPYKGDSASFDLNCCLVDLLPQDLGHFFYYSGSFTTPHCNEVVLWTVWEKPVVLSASQIAVFRGLFSNAAGDAKVSMADNFRPVQPLNGRKVYYYPESDYRSDLDPIYGGGDF